MASSTKPAPTGESATSAPADVPVVASDPVANQEDLAGGQFAEPQDEFGLPLPAGHELTRGQLLAAVESAAYARAHAVIEPTDTQGE